jgi:hypothetical protein
VRGILIVCGLFGQGGARRQISYLAVIVVVVQFKKKKKRIAPFASLVVVTKQSLHMVSEMVQSVTWEHFGFHCYDILL